MDDKLSKFVDRTGADPALARDLLQCKNWDFDGALKAFQELALGPSKTSEQSVVTRKTKTTKGKRGLSVVNCDIVHEARNKVRERDFPSNGGTNEGFDEMARYTFVLPDLSQYPSEFSDFLRRDLIETSTLVSLEQTGHLNWWADIGVCQRLVPLATVGDGNCLLHAASLGMWGYHDRLLTLRKALFRTLTCDQASAAIKRRWRLQQWRKNQEAGGLVYTEQEWEKEWEEVLRIASTVRRQSANTHSSGESLTLEHRMESIEETDDENNKENSSVNAQGLGKLGSQESESLKATNEVEHEKSTVGNSEINQGITTQESNDSISATDDVLSDSLGAFESLEDIHVFVLSHVLQRPIVVIAEQFLRDFSGEAIAPIPFGGIFLPLECSPEKCYKNPLVLTFESAHFSAVVASDEKPSQGKKDRSLMAAVPVVGPNYELLPIHFSVDSGPDFEWGKLESEEKDDKLVLTMEQKLQLLGKYLDIAEVKIPGTGKKDSATSGNGNGGSADAQLKETKSKQESDSKGTEGKERSWLANQLVRVGNLAGILGSVVHSTVYVAKLQANNKPDYYDKMIENYIQSAQGRFEEEKKEQAEGKATGTKPNMTTQPCIAPGCHMYGTAATNYLCSGCYKHQKSLSEKGNYSNLGNYGNSNSSASTESGNTASAMDNKPEGSFTSYLPPPSFSSYVPYDYFSAVRGGSPSKEEGPSSRTSGGQPLPPIRGTLPPPPPYTEATKHTDSTAPVPTSSSAKYGPAPTKCQMEGCDFYGNAASMGLCSSCFKKKQVEPKSVTS